MSTLAHPEIATLPRDLRPIIARNLTNGISRAEAVRDQIYDWFETLRTSQGVDLLVVKSPPYDAKVWVAVEAWAPVGGEGMTQRRRVEIEIAPRDFCRWPCELTVTRKTSPRTKVDRGVVDFTQENATAVLRWVLGETPNARFGLSRCRVHPWQFWRPRNSPLGLDPDFIGGLPAVLVAFVLLPFVVGAVAAMLEVRSVFAAFAIHVVLAVALVALLAWWRNVDFVNAWRTLAGGRLVASVGAAPAADANGARDMRNAIILIALFLLSCIAFFVPALRLLFVAAAVVIGVANFYRTRLSLSGGRPAAEPRSLLRLDSWQALLIGLGRERDAVKAALLADLRTNADASWTVSEERLWHWSIDGKEEREQIVVGLRSALVFVHIYAYDRDLYVGWDAHVNRGQWVESLVGSGVSRETGALCDVRTIVSGTRLANEYDITDANCVLERVHAILTRIVKRKLAEHELDQEIDFSIVREQRQGLTRDDSQKARRPLLSALGLRRKA